MVCMSVLVGEGMLGVLGGGQGESVGKEGCVTTGVGEVGHKVWRG